jgi:hypothetical protein
MGARRHGHCAGRKTTPTWNSWHCALARCRDAFRGDMASYYAKGIHVCARWRDRERGFENFLADMGERPEGATLGRKKQAGNYEPGNCEWQTKAQQNARLLYIGTRYATVGGVTMTYEEWAVLVGVKYDSFLRRLERGWSLEEACSIRYKRTRRKHAVSSAKEKG